VAAKSQPDARPQSLRKQLRAHASPEIAKHSQRFFKTGPGEYGAGDRFLGIRVGAIRGIVRANRAAGDREVLALLRSAHHEERLLALLMLVDRFARGDAGRRKEIYGEYMGNLRFVNNWDLVDSSASQIVGAYLEERSRRPLYRLARSTNLWQRRVAIIATLRFIKIRDFADTLAIAESLLGDEEDLIHKAVGWMLREVANRDRPTAEQFLLAHHREMPRTMLRYAIERLPERQRLRYLKGTVGP
jgi:3-methyladenine DNA glycosylase AlkD